jgi:hypothetical protein
MVFLQSYFVVNKSCNVILNRDFDELRSPRYFLLLFKFRVPLKISNADPSRYGEVDVPKQLGDLRWWSVDCCGGDYVPTATS